MSRPNIGYLYRRPDSPYWWIKLQYPPSMNRKKIQKSLETSDRAEAEIKALPMIEQHKRDLYLNRYQLNRKLYVRNIVQIYKDGETKLSDGRNVFANKDEALIFKDDIILERVANQKFIVEDTTSIFNPFEEEKNIKEVRNKKASIPASSTCSIIDRWVRDNSIDERVAKDARDTLDLFNYLVGDKALSDCKRSDGIKLIDHMRDKGLKWPTIDKKIGFLRAACNNAIRHELLIGNPFADIMPDKNKRKSESLLRKPYSEDDMLLMYNNLSSLREDEQLLWRILATTGMRRSEAFEIDHELVEKGVRYTIVGAKTPSSKRRVPFPTKLIDFLPHKINRPLFGNGSPVIIGKRLLRRTRELGILDEAKVIHSLRHRAKDRLRAEGCKLDMQHYLLGHEEQTVAKDYGVGYPVPKYLEWIDKIGIIDPNYEGINFI